MTVTDIEPVPVDTAVPAGYWQRESAHAPRPLSPFHRAVMASVAPGTRAACLETGSLYDGLEMREIGGWVYVRLVPVGGRSGPTPPMRLMPVLIRVVPALRRRVRTCVEAARTDLYGRLVDRWYDEWRPELGRRIAELRAVDRARLADAGLRAHLDETLAFVAYCHELHFRLHSAIAWPLGRLARLCRDLPGWDDACTFDLLAGTSSMSTAPARALADLAAAAARSTAVRPLIEVGGDTEGVLAADPAFAEAFASYLREYGGRALSMDVSDPTLAEEPGLVLALIRDQLARGFDPAATDAAVAAGVEAATDRVRQLLADRPEEERERFEELRDRARRAFPLREDDEFFTISAPYALVRYAALEIGARLAARDRIDGRDDVFFLEAVEAAAELSESGPLQDLVRRRRGERAWVLAHPGPAAYGEPPGPPPSMEAFPPEVRFQTEMAMWLFEHMEGPRHEPSEAPPTVGVVGLGVAAGRYTGPARIVGSEADFSRIRAGDVLVCPITSPVWSVLFPSVGALVTDRGGALCHAAIIAREFGIPAVVGTGDATARLRDGELVTIDGSTGRVTREGDDD